jgi:S1-C subfamily serine protease
VNKGEKEMKLKRMILTFWFLFFAFLLTWTIPGYAQRRVLSSLEEDITNLVESVKPSLVTIETEAYVLKEGKRKSIPSTFVGSGIIYTPDGYILTSATVASGRKDLKVTLLGRKSLQGKLVGTDEESNLAVLKIEATGLIPARLGNSDKVKVGSWLTVVGNSYGLPNAVALGLVNGVREDGFIQMSANVSPGNSGGPVLDTYGNVIGLVVAKLSEPSYIDALTLYTDKSGKRAITIPPRQIEIPSSGVSLALPVNKVRTIADQIIKYGDVRRGYLGIYPEEVRSKLSQEYGFDGGVLVGSIVEGSPAEKAGLQDGDMIVEFAGVKVEDVSHIRQLIKDKPAGSQVELVVSRGEEKKRLNAILGAAQSAYSYSWWSDVQIPEPPKPITAEFYQEAAQDYARQVQELEEQDKRSLEELKRQLKELTKQIEEMNLEIEKLKEQKSR